MQGRDKARTEWLWKQLCLRWVCAQPCRTLCNSMDCSLPGSSVCGILQARTLEWVAISYSKESWKHIWSQSVSSVAQLCPTLWDPMDCSARQASLSITNSQSLLKLMSIQPSHPLSSPSPPAFNLSQHWGLFQGVSSLHQVAKVLEFQLHHQSFQWIFKTDLL